MPPKFDLKSCNACGTCIEVCPGDLLGLNDKEEPEVIYPDECWHCGNCRIHCPCDAVSYDFPISMLI